MSAARKVALLDRPDPQSSGNLSFTDQQWYCWACGLLSSCGLQQVAPIPLLAVALSDLRR